MFTIHFFSPISHDSHESLIVKYVPSKLNSTKKKNGEYKLNQ